MSGHVLQRVGGFLFKGEKVGAVWREFHDEKHEKWNKARLPLSTNSKLCAEDIIVAYVKHWSIKSTFNELKNAWGAKEAWRQTLNRWVQLTTIGYGLIQLPSLMPSDKLGGVMLQCRDAIDPRWRQKKFATDW